MTATDSIDTILDRHHRDGTRLLQILRETQEALGWLAPETLTHIAAAIGWPRAKVEGTAGFYRFFHTRPLGRYRVLWSDNITDRMLGSAELMHAMCAQLWLEPGRVSEDGLVSVDTTSCTGMCDQGPAVLVNYRAVTGMTIQRVNQMAELIRSEIAVPEWPAEWFSIADNIRRADILLGNTSQPGTALRAAISRGAGATLDEIKLSNLRGRGGAGYTTGLKWEACRDAPVPAGNVQRYIVCNADEGEPGTFKDRVLLTTQADLVVDGMTVAAYVVGATKGYIYLRGEYRYLLDQLTELLARRRASGLLGRDIAGQAGFCFDIEVHLGAGAYICGEESALIESLEGKRGIPRNRPPYPITNGFLNCPTVVNNVETFASAALIALNGGEWYRNIGTAKSSGTKLLSISGDCARPGIYEVPFGIAVADILEDCGASRVQAVQISGPSGVCIDATEFNRRIAFEDLPTAGAFMIFNQQRDMFAVARNFAHFFADESCGFCTPCRVGTSLLRNCMDKIENGHASQHTMNEIFQLNRLLQTASHCGLGHTACNPMLDTMKKFRPAYERRLKSLDFEPSFDLDSALAQARQMTGRDDAASHLEGQS